MEFQREATLLSHLQRSHPGVTDVHLSVGGVCRYHLWVQFAKKREGEAKNVILCAFGAHYDIKQVVVVDTDVDIHDPAEIEWAIATRFQADRDLVLIEGAQGSPLDPSTTIGQPDDTPAHLQGISTKMGLTPRGRWCIRAMCSPACEFPATTQSTSTRWLLPITMPSTRT